MHQPIVSPSFASWQVSRGIVPWTIAPRHLRAFMAELVDRIIETWRELLAALKAFVANLVEAFKSIEQFVAGVVSRPSGPPARPALAHKLNIRALPPLPPRVFHGRNLLR